MPAYTSISKPNTSYSGSGLWTSSYLTWLITSFPWLVGIELSRPVTTYTNVFGHTWNEFTMLWSEATETWDEYATAQWTNINKPS